MEIWRRKFGKPDFSFRNEIRFYTFSKRNSNSFIFPFSSTKLHKIKLPNVS